MQGWAEPLGSLVAATDFERNVYRWEIYNRKPLRSWSRGRVSFVGDAVHPVSPYAGYGMGMAIEDGFWLARSLAGVDLADRAQLAEGLARYDERRVPYTNRHAGPGREEPSPGLSRFAVSGIPFHRSSIEARARADRTTNPVRKPAASTMKPAIRLLNMDPRLRAAARSPWAKLARSDSPIRSWTTMMATTLNVPAAMPSST